MKLSEDIKNLIRQEYAIFENRMYAGKSEEERQELAQFFTPPEISIKLLETYDVDSLAGKVIRDPTSGSGNLLAACLIAGADSDKVFGNDYDAAMVKLCRERLNAVCDLLGKPHIRDWQIHRGDALDSFCLTNFGPDYKDKLIGHYYEGSVAEFVDPNHEQIESWLSLEQLEFLKEVD